jgi:hypothetical protein
MGCSLDAACVSIYSDAEPPRISRHKGDGYALASRVCVSPWRAALRAALSTWLGIGVSPRAPHAHSGAAAKHGNLLGGGAASHPKPNAVEHAAEQLRA